MVPKKVIKKFWFMHASVSIEKVCDAQVSLCGKILDIKHKELT